MMEMDFQGQGLEGYDNVKKKFVSTWIDNMGTGIMIAEGTYDPATKTFTYNSEMEMIPGMKTKVRETVKVTDKDHHTFEYFEDPRRQRSEDDGDQLHAQEIARVHQSRQCLSRLPPRGGRRQN